jgi:hypothetical protein
MVLYTANTIDPATGDSRRNLVVRTRMICLTREETVGQGGTYGSKDLWVSPRFARIMTRGYRNIYSKPPEPDGRGASSWAGPTSSRAAEVARLKWRDDFARRPRGKDISSSVLKSWSQGGQSSEKSGNLGFLNLDLTGMLLLLCRKPHEPNIVDSPGVYKET